MTMPLPELAKVANLYARSSPDDPIVAGLREFIADVSPLLYVMADTKVGKTHRLARLFRASTSMQDGKEVRYPASSLVTPVRYIDADEGAATFGHLLDSPHLNYQRCTRPSKEIRPWMIRQIAEASDDKHCKASVIEGLNLIY